MKYLHFEPLGENDKKPLKPSNQMTITSNDYSHPSCLCLIPSRKISLWLFTSDLKGVHDCIQNFAPILCTKIFSAVASPECSPSNSSHIPYQK